MDSNNKIIENQVYSFNNPPKPVIDYFSFAFALYFIGENINKKKKGTGFFMKFKKEDNYLKFIMTCHHCYKSAENEENPHTLEINYYYKSYESQVLKINLKERDIKDYTYKNLDIITINVLEEDNIPEELFFECCNKNELGNLKGKTIQIIQYPKEKLEPCINAGQIKDIDISNYEIIHNVSTDVGSSGSPIFFENNLKILGIHKSGTKIINNNELTENEIKNYGNFIYPIAYTLLNNLTYNNKEDENGIYEGEMKNNEKYGYGTYKDKNGDSYKGEWINNKKNGRGKWFNKNGINYEGDFLDDKKDGDGILYNEKGQIYYQGKFSEDKKNGKGKIYGEKNNILYDGDFLNDKKNGKGILYDENRHIIYDGNFKDDKKHGIGRFYEEDGNYLQGTWVDDKKNGKFAYFSKNGSPLGNQLFYNDIRTDTCCNKFCDHLRWHKCGYITLLIFIIIIISVAIILIFTYFFLKCEKGEGDKCLTCKKFTKSCSSCNEGYELYEGECITYQFMVKYFIGFDKQINIINYYHYKRIYKIKLDYKETYNFKYTTLEFPSYGEHTVHFYFDKKTFDSFSYLFENIDSIIEFNFNNKCDYSNIIDMDYMFFNSSIYKIKFNNVSFPNLVSMKKMFFNSYLNSIYFSNFNAPNLNSVSEMFKNCTWLEVINFDNFNAKKLSDVSYMFEDCEILDSIDFTGFYSDNLEIMSNMFYSCDSLGFINFGSLNTKNVKDMSGLFEFCRSLYSVNLSNFDTSNVINMESMFMFCESLPYLNLSNFDTRNVINMLWMFDSCHSLTSLDISNFNTDKVKDMDSMFYGCKSLKSLDVSSFNTKNVKYMRSLFGYCELLTSLNLSNFETNGIVSMYEMFYECSNLSFIDLSNAVIKPNVNYYNIFYGISNLGKIILNKNGFNNIKSLLPNWEIIIKNE